MANPNPKYDIANLMPPWQPGSSANPRGRPKGIRKAIREVLHGHELAGETVPGGRTVLRAMIEAACVHVIRGKAPGLFMDLMQMAGYDVKGEIHEDGQRVTFEIVPNHRDRPAELEGKPADGSAEPTESTA
jgi:Family of unknown function (DUF5681)